MSRYIARTRAQLAHLTLSNKKAIPGCENQVSPIFLVALLYGSYPMPVMFSYCLIGSYATAGHFSTYLQHQHI